ncbi:MAG: BT4734/BF3469 family protein, partial [Chitinophagaceae bacterium]
MAASTIFKNFATPVENVSLIILSNWIASDKYKAQVEEIRDMIAQGNAEEAQKKKQQLPAFTPSATFTEKRLLPNMENYSGFVHLDFDKLTPEQLNAAFQIIAAISYTFICFISPSGNGLKVFIEVNTGADHHDTAYQQVMEYYQNATGLKADLKCKDITRLCFVSHDPQLYKNIYNEKFPVKDIPVQAKPVPVITMQETREESTAPD